MMCVGAFFPLALYVQVTQLPSSGCPPIGILKNDREEKALLYPRFFPLFVLEEIVAYMLLENKKDLRRPSTKIVYCAV